MPKLPVSNDSHRSCSFIFYFVSCYDSIICDFRLMDVLLRVYKQETPITSVVQGQNFLLFSQMVDWVDELIRHAA